ncbi:MAG TPA: G-D-S-L family lipolytic protein [Clostridium sp.]|nr:G-D-S-L family lipolytic protein [Clostridium sp.]
MKIKEYYNFVVYGDSISKGVVYDEVKERYVVLKENFVNLVGNNLKAAIHNRGKFGNNIIRGQEKLEKDVLKRDPDILLIEFGGNDCDYDWQAIANNPEGEFSPKTDLELFSKTLNNIIDYCRKLNILPMLMTLPPLDSKRYFKWVSKKDRKAEKNILKWLGDVNRIYYWQEQYSKKGAEVAKENDVELIDVREAFLKEKEYSKFLCIDGIHPNKEGHKLIAKKVMDYFNNNLNYILR